MAELDASHLDFEFEVDFDDVFDPLADDGLGEDDENAVEAVNEDEVDPEFDPTFSSNLGVVPEGGSRPAPTADTRTAAERIAGLLAEMGKRRTTLLRIVGFCRAPQRAAAVNDYVDELQKVVYSVYTGADLTAQLERAGALVRTTEDGSPYTAVEIAPKTVEVDGVEYLEATEAPEVYWLATPEGVAALDGDNPGARIEAMLEEEPAYLPIYKRVLELCCAEEGAAITAIEGAVNGDPLLAEPRRVGAYFVERLEKCGALEWAKPWRITDAGREALAALAGVDAEEA